VLQRTLAASRPLPHIRAVGMDRRSEAAAAWTRGGSLPAFCDERDEPEASGGAPALRLPHAILMSVF
jgi:hypothetical protein